MRIAVDQDAFEEGVLQIAIDTEGEQPPEYLVTPAGRVNIVKSDSIETGDGQPVYEVDYNDKENN